MGARGGRELPLATATFCGYEPRPALKLIYVRLRNLLQHVYMFLRLMMFAHTHITHLSSSVSMYVADVLCMIHWKGTNTHCKGANNLSGSVCCSLLAMEALIYKQSKSERGILYTPEWRPDDQ